MSLPAPSPHTSFPQSPTCWLSRRMCGWHVRMWGCNAGVAAPPGGGMRPGSADGTGSTLPRAAWARHTAPTTLISCLACAQSMSMLNLFASEGAFAKPSHTQKGSVLFFSLWSCKGKTFQISQLKSKQGNTKWFMVLYAALSSSVNLRKYWNSRKSLNAMGSVRAAEKWARSWRATLYLPPRPKPHWALNGRHPLSPHWEARRRLGRNAVKTSK